MEDVAILGWVTRALLLLLSVRLRLALTSMQHTSDTSTRNTSTRATYTRKDHGREDAAGV